MKLPNWFKISWWIFLIVLMIVLLYPRYPTFIDGGASSIDLIIFIILLAVMISPLFEEYSLLGFSFKKEVEKLKSDVREEVASLKNEIHNSINFNPQFIYPLPPPDSQLPDLEERVKNAVESVLESQGINRISLQAHQINTPDDANYLFNVRYNIEKELRRIWNNNFGQEDIRRPIAITQMAGMLAKSELIPQKLVHAIREVYSVCSPAIHGEEVSEAQLNFVKDVAPMLINTLKNIR